MASPASLKTEKFVPGSTDDPDKAGVVVVMAFGLGGREGETFFSRM